MIHIPLGVFLEITPIGGHGNLISSLHDSYICGSHGLGVTFFLRPLDVDSKLTDSPENFFIYSWAKLD